MNVVYLCVNMLRLVGSGLYNYITNLAGQIDVSVACKTIYAATLTNENPNSLGARAAGRARKIEPMMYVRGWGIARIKVLIEAHQP